MAHQFWRLSAAGPDNLGPACTDDGLLLGRTPLIERRDGCFVVRNRGEIERLFEKAYGGEPRVDRLMYGLSTVASALIADDACLARIAAVHLKDSQSAGSSSARRDGGGRFAHQTCARQSRHGQLESRRCIRVPAPHPILAGSHRPMVGRMAASATALLDCRSSAPVRRLCERRRCQAVAMLCGAVVLISCACILDQLFEQVAAEDIRRAGGRRNYPPCRCRRRSSTRTCRSSCRCCSAPRSPRCSTRRYSRSSWSRSRCCWPWSARWRRSPTDPACATGLRFATASAVMMMMAIGLLGLLGRTARIAACEADSAIAVAIRGIGLHREQCLQHLRIELRAACRRRGAVAR